MEINADRPKAIKILGFIVAIIVVVGLIRIFSGEDTWICKNGQWVKHGNPSSPMPATPCLAEGAKAEENGNNSSLPNPASQNCLNKGGRLESLQETAGTLGICKFDDGTECEEWKFFRNECQKGQFKKADTSHPYTGVIKQNGKDYLFISDTGIQYTINLPETVQNEIKVRLASEVKTKESIVILAAETPPLSKILLLQGFEEK